MTSDRSGMPNGSAVAAMAAVGVGLLALGIVVLATERSASAKDTVFALGKAWIPGAEGIGPYSGKETVMLLAWLGSWPILHAALRNKRVPVRPWFGTTLIMILIATLLVWPPVWHLLGA